MLKTLGVAALFALAGTAFAQSTPSTTPSDTPSVTPSDTPSIPPQGTVVVPPVTTPSPSVGPAPSIGGLSKCENMIGAERDTCMQQERASTGSTSAGSTGAAGSSTSGTSTQPTAPIGSPTGSVR